ncbi:hypothetical protein EUZ93_01080 [Wolbachia pipientis]|nr:hypothetical protein [Wolbachia pipientis]NEV49106.1 hypothetical protein [Wolbachia pipientis]
MIGSIRLVVQRLSYEVRFIIIILSLIIIRERYSFIDFYKMQKYFDYIIYLFSLFLIF